MPRELPPERVNNLAASYQEAIVDVLVAKCRRALSQSGRRVLCVGGGVTQRPPPRALENAAAETSTELVLADPAYCTDNAAMAAHAWELIERQIFAPSTSTSHRGSSDRSRMAFPSKGLRSRSTRAAVVGRALGYEPPLGPLTPNPSPSRGEGDRTFLGSSHVPTKRILCFEQDTLLCRWPRSCLPSILPSPLEGEGPGVRGQTGDRRGGHGLSFAAFQIPSRHVLPFFKHLIVPKPQDPPKAL